MTGAALVASPLGRLALVFLAVLTAVVEPRAYGLIGMANIPAIAGSTKGQITAAATRDEEIIWEQKVGVIAAQVSPFADNMTGVLGSGKPIIIKNDTQKVKGTAINITTIDQLGGPGVSGNGPRTGVEEQVSPGDFQLIVNIKFFPVGIDNTGKSQTVVGAEWDDVVQQMLGIRLAKQQSDDALQDLKCEASNSFNVIYPSGKSLDSISSVDTYSTSLIERSAGLASDIGAVPCDARPIGLKDQMAGKVGRFYQFHTHQNIRPLRNDELWLTSAQRAQERGKGNPLFTGDYFEWDNNAVIPWQNVRHGGIGSIGSSLQPDALWGIACLAHTSGVNTYISADGAASQVNNVTGATGQHGLVSGGGSATKSTTTPLRNFFEFFPLFAYTPINGVTQTFNMRTSSATSPLGGTIQNLGFFCVIDSVTQKWSFFSYTGNNGNQLTGVKRLGSIAEGDYATTIGDVTWGTAPYTTAGDGAGFAGVSEGAITVGSPIYECNSKGVPLAYGYCLGEMALVAGYGRIALPGGDFRTSIHRTEYIEPHNRAFSKGIEVCYGTAAFKRPDGQTPNYVLQVYARSIPGCPVVT